MHVAAIIAAGGRSVRFGGSVPKQLYELEGSSVLERSVAAFATHERIDEIVVVLPSELVESPPAFLTAEAKRHAGDASRVPVRLTAGGARRQDSVANGFAAVTAAADLVVIHDAARPFVTAELISKTIDAAWECGAALAACEARDTVKLARTATGASATALAGAAGGASDAGLFVERTTPRERVFLAQTPQAFRVDVLRAALTAGEAADGRDATDEASLVERAGLPVRIVAGDPRNIKITTPDDLAVARGLLSMSDGARETRIGVGFDLHRLVEGRPLILGGITIPFDKGLAGFSDADVVCHAVTDAILGAAKLGDIGRHFPPGQSDWKDADSIDLLRRAAAMVREAGYESTNVDVVIIAERPTLAPFVDGMAARVAVALGIDSSCVSVKAKTHEGVGELGRSEAIAAHAVAMIRRR